MAERPTVAAFRKKALKNPAVKAEYEALSAVFEMKRRMIAMRMDAGVTQEELAKRLGTAKSNISRLESLNSDISPRLSTIEDYARALGYSARIEFEPLRP